MTLHRPNLMDLSRFGIHIMNPEFRCIRCAASVRGWSEGVFADELCQGCKHVGRDLATRRTRYEAMFYRPQSVYAMHPTTYLSGMRAIWGGVRLAQQSVSYFTCVVKIDGEPYVGRSRGNYVSLHDGQGRVVREYGLQISQAHLGTIYGAQQRAASGRR